METTDDEFLDGSLKLLQPKTGFRAGLDSVLLAASAKVRVGDQVLDAGCGAGVAGLCLAARVPGIHLNGIDINQDAIDLCADNAARNNIAASFVHGDVVDVPRVLGHDAFDHVISNPPFHDQTRERASPDASKARAHGFEGDYAAAMEAWVHACLAVLKTKGRITLINRAEALPAMLAALDPRAGEIIVVPLWPRAGEPATRVIVAARKGTKSPAKLHSGFVLHEQGGRFTSQIDAALRGSELPVA